MCVIQIEVWMYVIRCIPTHSYPYLLCPSISLSEHSVSLLPPQIGIRAPPRSPLLVCHIGGCGNTSMGLGDRIVDETINVSQDDYLPLYFGQGCIESKFISFANKKIHPFRSHVAILTQLH